MPINVIQKLKNLKISDSNFAYYLRIIGKDEIELWEELQEFLLEIKFL